MKAFLSRKFLLALAAGVIVFLNGAFDLGLNQVEVLSILGSFLSFVVVEGTADIKGRN